MRWLKHLTAALTLSLEHLFCRFNQGLTQNTMNRFLLPMLLAAFVNASAQRTTTPDRTQTKDVALIAKNNLPTPDKIETAKGPLTIQPVQHAAMVFTWNGKTIFVDPYGGPNAFKGLGTPDIVIITDIHPDHLDSATLMSIDLSKATLVVPQGVHDKLPGDLHKRARVLNNGDSTSLNDLTIIAIPMYNTTEDRKAMHTKGRGNGYIVEMGGKRIYISGDTEDIPEMRSLKNIDVAFVCMNLPYTMDVKQAAAGVLAFKPKIIYPYHYRGNPDMSNTEDFKKLVNAGDKSIDVRLRDWYTKL
jgi:L-ascorbate metabolism protein UlaG (beta-lactamase superfamily)